MLYKENWEEAKKHMSKILIFLTFLCLNPVIVIGEKTMDYLPTIAINSVDVAPVIDGKLDDSCWKYASEISPFILHHGKEIATQQTKSWIIYDKDNIYIAFECFDINLGSVLKYVAFRAL